MCYITFCAENRAFYFGHYTPPYNVSMSAVKSLRCSIDALFDVWSYMLLETWRLVHGYCCNIHNIVYRSFSQSFLDVLHFSDFFSGFAEKQINP